MKEHIGKFLIYTSDNCSIFGYIESTYKKDKLEYLILRNGKKITPYGLVERSQLVVNLEGIYKNAKEFSGTLKFVDSIDVSDSIMDQIFIDIVSYEPGKTKLGISHLIGITEELDNRLDEKTKKQIKNMLKKANMVNLENYYEKCN